MFTLKNFRIIALLEGISYILLLGVGTPLKYFGITDVLVKALGMPHGILFVTYVIMAFVIKFAFKEIQQWNLKDFLIILVCSLLPFGTFYVDKKYLQTK